jgi:hypothetical protein
LSFQSVQLADAHDARTATISSLNLPFMATPDGGTLLRPIAASGGFLLRLDWPALTPDPTEMKLLALERI